MTRETAERFVRLYPAAWRARYGDEFIEVLVEQRASFTLVMDVLGGAIDARLQRGRAVAAASGGNMTSSLMKRCAAGGPHLSMAEAWRSAAVTVGASLTFASLYILASMHVDDKDLVDAFGIMAYPAALLVAMPFYSMKNASRGAKITVVGGCLMVLAAISYLTTFLS